MHRFLIAAGDPMQLPPVLTRAAAPTAPMSGQLQSNQQGATLPQPQHLQQFGLQRPLFTRLTQLYRAHLLATQYRCHPAMSAIPNRLFYGGRLRDGCSSVQRAPLAGLEALPAVAFVNVAGARTERGHGGSSYNQAEVRAHVSSYDILLHQAP